MSTLLITEKSAFEKLLRMSGGGVLEFSNNSLQNFVADSVGLDIYDEKYNQGSGSKANRLRAFLRHESDELVGKLLGDLILTIPSDWERRKEYTGNDISVEEQQAYEAAKHAQERLIGKLAVESLDALQAIDYDANFRLLSREIQASIDKGEPGAGLDRLHTFLIKYFRHLCAKRSITTTKDEALHAVFGKYRQALLAAGTIKSEMGQLIMKSSISLLDKFNFVRNNQSLAHDNNVLDREESLLIFRNITALVQFVEYLEQGV